VLDGVSDEMVHTTKWGIILPIGYEERSECAGGLVSQEATQKHACWTRMNSVDEASGRRRVLDPRKRVSPR
jgi:hypothetical protein